MKLTFTLIAILLVGSLQAADPELDRLRTNYKAAVDRATKPLLQAYIAELERLRDGYARATKLDAANAVQAEINEVKQALPAGGSQKTSSLSSPALTSASGGKPNLLVNPSFEDGLNGWVFTSADHHGAGTVDTSETHEGKNSFRIDNPSEDDCFLRQTVAVKPLTRYRFTGHIKTKGVPAPTSPHSGAALSVDGTFEHTEPITGNKSWTKMSFEFDTGNVESVKIGPRMGQRATAGVAWFDDLSLVEVGPARKGK